MDEIQESERCLVFENYQHTLSQNIINYLDKQAFVNITLVCNGEKIGAHQIILSACSPLFEKILLEEKQAHPMFFFNDIAKTEMEFLLQYMYTGRVSVPKSIVPSVLKVAKQLQILGNEEFDNIQNISIENPVDARNITPDLSPILTQSNALNTVEAHTEHGNSVPDTLLENPANTSNVKTDLCPILTQLKGDTTGAEAREHDNAIPVVPEKNDEEWITVTHNSDKQKDHGKKVLNPFAKKLNSSTDSDSTVFENDKTFPSPSKSPLEKKPVVDTSPVSSDSDVEFIEVNSVVVIADTQINDNSLSCGTTKKRNPSVGCDEFNVAECKTDKSEHLSSKRAKIDHKVDRYVENSGKAAKVKVNPVALKKRSKDDLKKSSKDTTQCFPTSSNSHGNGDGIHKNSDRSGSNQGHASDQSDKNQNDDLPVPSSSKKKHNPPPPRKTTEPFEGFFKMSVVELYNFCILCNKKCKNIREHIKKDHHGPPRGKKISCKICSKVFSLEKSLTYHNCK